MTSTNTVSVMIDGEPIECPLVIGSEGEHGIDLADLRKRTGYVTLDPGFINTASCSSAITFIDGEKGILRYRGIPIEELAKKATFLETCYLLINGNLPTLSELEQFKSQISRHTMLHEGVKEFYAGFPRDAHPMATLASVVCSMSTFYQQDQGTPEEISYMHSIRLIAKLPTIVAWAYKKSIGQPFMYPRNDLAYCENFLHMMFGVPTEETEILPEVVRTLDMLLIIHADHEQNCSTSTVRLVRSSMSNMFASIASGICALWGHRHGGANQRVVEMLEQIRCDGGNVKKYVDKAKDKNSGFRLMGFGHRVYKNYDPRATIIKEQCGVLLDRLKINDPLLDLAKELEQAALTDDYFIEKKLFPNVDFYSGIIYRALGIPVPAFPVMFALGRLPGWIAHAREYTLDPANRIGRPRQIYTGPTKVEFLPIEQRA